MTVYPLLFGNFFEGAIFVNPEHNPLTELGKHYHGWFSFALHGLITPAFWLALAGAVTAWYIYMKRPELPAQLQNRYAVLQIANNILQRKYGFDEFNQAFFANGGIKFGKGLWKWADAGLIDGLLVNGAAKTIGWLSGIVRQIQSGYLYHYAFAMIIGLLGLLTWITTR
jgi:NADH-quinone oxidoreductase subunit L